ncbi:MAG TPA: hypothetical protein VMN57_06250 [Anaerolineales bacterium]|nr:hypothetical protein [Anaerolineales bacterium]
MKPKLFLTIAALYFLLGAVPSIIAPALNYYLDAGTSTYSLHVLRATTCLLAGLGVVYWLARNAEPSLARDAIFMGSAIGFGLNVIFMVLAGLSPDGVGITWGIAAVNLLFAIGFFVVGRANMSTAAA